MLYVHSEYDELNGLMDQRNTFSLLLQIVKSKNIMVLINRKFFFLEKKSSIKSTSKRFIRFPFMTQQRRVKFLTMNRHGIPPRHSDH